MWRCGQIKENGTPCESPVMIGRKYFHFHDDDPRTIELRKARSSKGGKVSRTKPEIVA